DLHEAPLQQRLYAPAHSSMLGGRLGFGFDVSQLPAAPFPRDEADAAEHDARADEELDQHHVVEAVAARGGVVDSAEKLEFLPGAFEARLLDGGVLRELQQRAYEERCVEGVAIDLAVHAAVAVEDAHLEQVVEARRGGLVAKAQILRERIQCASVRRQK